jgi:transcriptional regulator with XRE-family HTH domain
MVTNFRSLQERLRERLRAQIAAGELTGLQLARATGFQQAHISNFLNCKRGLSLEAMDAILAAAHIRFEELLGAPSRSRHRTVKGETERAGLVPIPIVDERNLTATQVPNQSPRNTLWIATPVVQRWRSAMQVPRHHWQRFVAVRVKRSDAEAMSPRLTRGAVAVVDRHHNRPSKHALPQMFLVCNGNNFEIRYLEITGGVIVARSHNPELPVQLLGSEPESSTFSRIIGRVCFVHIQL